MIGGLKQLIKLFSNYDTKLQKYDTKNIYKVDEVFYYRKKINYKIYRISLKTKSIKIALNRKKIFEKMNKEELLFTLQKGDYKFIFEYETIEELNQHLNSISNIVIDKDKEVEKFENVNRLLMQEKDKVNKTINFYELETKFIANKKEELEETKDKIAKSTWQKYQNVFKDLKEYFDVRDINDINENQYKEFRNYLIKKKLNNVTINEKMQYTNMFLNFAKVKKFIKENNMENIKKLKVEETKRELFTLAEMKNIFSYDNYNYNAKEVFKILLFTGMRINEFYNLKKENLKNRDGIDYIEVTTSKTRNGLREIPRHKEIKKNLERFDFNEIHKMDASSFSKKILYELYRVIKKGDKKTLHTFRKNFANQIINKYPDHIELFQEILGHSQGSKSLSLQTYGKGFNLENKKVLIDSLEFDINFEY